MVGKMSDYLIIGNGVAGKKAAETIRGLDKSGSITVVSSENHDFYYRPQLPSFVAGKVEKERLFDNQGRFYEENNIDLLLGTKAVNVLPFKNRVVFDNGSSLEYGKLLLSPGGRLKQRVYPGGEGTSGVVGMKTLDDAAFIKGKIDRLKHALVIGESFLATYLVEALNEGGVSVTYILRNENLFPNLLDVDASAILERRLQLKGVNVLKDEDIREICVSDGSVNGVKTINDNFIECQLVGIADGLKPDIEFVRNAEIATGEGIFVDKQMRTNVPDIFAAGDAAMRISSGNNEMPQINIRWLKAWKQGIVAGKNMVGNNASYDDLECFASTRIYDVNLVSLGISNPCGGKYKIMTGKHAQIGKDIYKKIVLDNGKIVGALLVGDVAEASILMDAIAKEKMITDIDEGFVNQMFGAGIQLKPNSCVVCPVCKLDILSDSLLKEGSLIGCPACGIDINLKENMVQL